MCGVCGFCRNFLIWICFEMGGCSGGCKEEVVRGFMKDEKGDEGRMPTAVWESGDVLRLGGDWVVGRKVLVEGARGWPRRFETGALGSFDSSLPAFLLSLMREFEVKADGFAGLPDDLRGLMELATKVPERTDAKSREERVAGLVKLGRKSTAVWDRVEALLDFTGKTVISLLRFAVGRARFRKDDFWRTVQECGVGALPIVSLISFLIGMILAFVGNVQLAQFGASIYVANLVGIAMTREMGVMMTAIIMSGRTGAAFAAHIGSMRANQEIDALRTFGFNPFEYLVLPRVIALVLMMPLLTVYANVVGILGGMLVAAGVGIPPNLFLTEMLTMLDLTQASLGVIKSMFFGAAIAVSGCLQGMNAGNSSAAVGEATTRAVVASITAVIILDSAFAVAFTLLEI